MAEKTRRPLNLGQQFTDVNSFNQVQQVKSVGNQPRPTSLSPNMIAATNARALSTPSHVKNVQVTVTRASDATSKVTVSFKRDPGDAYFSEGIVYVSGYKSNPAPVRVASGQSPISFSLENTGEPVSVTVQANGNLGPAPLSTAPNATLKLDKTNLATVSTTAGNGPSTSATFQTNSVNNSSQSILNLLSGNLIDVTNTSGGNVQFDFVGQRCPHYTVPSANQTFPGTPVGMNAGSVGFSSNSVAATSTEPAYWSGQTAATAGAQARVQSAATPSNSEITLGVWRTFQARVSVPTTTQVRVWIGFTNSVTQQSDTPTDTFGFRYSTAAGDTTWICYSNNGTSTTTVNSGVAIGTASKVFKIVGNGGSSLKFYIDGTLVGTISSNIESSSTGMFAWVSVDNVGVAQARNLRLYHIYYDTI